MENHVHLLICDEAGELSIFMKKLGVSYAEYYNKKYDRVGHLFQDIYKRQLKEKGITVRQLERLTGINRGIIQKA